MKKIFATLFALILCGAAWGQTAKVIWTAGNNTLTFVYDNTTYTAGSSTYGGQTVTKVWVGADYTTNTKGGTPSWNTELKTAIKTVNITSSFSNVSVATCANWFGECSNLEKVTGMANLKGVGSMASTFGGCSKLSDISLTGFDTSKVEAMSFTFIGCSSLTSLDVTGFNTSNVTTMRGMFQNCSNLTTLGETNVGGFDTSKVNNMGYMFSGCSKLSALNVAGFNTQEVTDMTYMFHLCKKLTSLTPNNFDTRKVTNMASMFRDCSGLDELDISGENFVTSEVTTMESMFNGCTNLETLTYNTERFNTAKVESMKWLFLNCNKLKSIDVSKFNTEKVTTMSGMFEGCRVITSLNISNFNTGKVTAMDRMFNSCPALGTLTFPATFTTSKVESMRAMFQSSGMKELDLSLFDTREVTNMGYMFSGCSKLKKIIVNTDDEHWNTSKVTDMKCMFAWSAAFEELDLSYYKTQNVTTMELMFTSCSKLKKLNIKAFNTSKVTTMNQMFQACKVLEELDLSEWKNTATTEMTNMFRDCEGLKRLKLSGFNTSAVTAMQYMFLNCSGLEELDLSSFDTSNVKNMAYMFQGCTGLYYLDLSHFKTSSMGSSYQYMLEGIPKVFVYMAPGRTDQITEGIKNTKTPNRQNIIIGSPGNFTCENCVFTDEARDLRLPYGFEAKKITYDRSLVNDKDAYTVFLPYELALPDGLRAYRLKKGECQTRDGIIYFEQTDGPLQANTPYIVANWSTATSTTMLNRSTATPVNNTFSYKDLTTYDGPNPQTTTLTDGSSVVMEGTYFVMKKDDLMGLYLMQSANQWKPVTEASKSTIKLAPMRAYLRKVGGDGRAMLSGEVAEDDETGVTEIGTETETETEIETIDHDGTRTRYDLSGRRLSRPTRGIHIVGGKKIIY